MSDAKSSPLAAFISLPAPAPIVTTPGQVTALTPSPVHASGTPTPSSGAVTARGNPRTVRRSTSGSSTPASGSNTPASRAGSRGREVVPTGKVVGPPSGGVTPSASAADVRGAGGAGSRRSSSSSDLSRPAGPTEEAPSTQAAGDGTPGWRSRRAYGAWLAGVDESLQSQCAALKQAVYLQWDKAVASKPDGATAAGGDGTADSDHAVATNGDHAYESDGDGDDEDYVSEEEAQPGESRRDGEWTRNPHFGGSFRIPPALPLSHVRSTTVEAPKTYVCVPSAKHAAHVPHSGISVPLIWPYPVLASGTAQGPVQLGVTRSDLGEELQAKWALRKESAAAGWNRIVYDSVAAPEELAALNFDSPDTPMGSAQFGGPQLGAAAGGAGSGGGGGAGGNDSGDDDSDGSGSDSDAAMSEDMVLQTLLKSLSDRKSRPLVVAAAGPAVRTPVSSDDIVADLPLWWRLQSPADHTLQFESRFESGNLRRATQVSEFEYDLLLKPDINTHRHTQWYYFSVSNTRSGAVYQFNIVNLMKGDSLYNQGMQPVIYSERRFATENIGWTRAGFDVIYFQNSTRRKGGYYYTLSFKLKFPYDNDRVFIAYCYPYTYTELRRYLISLDADPLRKNRALKSRRGVVISARVHPGESNASWMMHGMIEFLTGPSLDAKLLRDNFVFKIVPMLNPDGVVVGNYRCSLAGVDLNRVWKNPSARVHPTIYQTKELIRKFMDDRDVVMYVDLHGHSRKMNVFMYGCESKSARASKRRVRVFPRMLSRNCSMFSFKDCDFKIHKSKESTARVVVRKELGLPNSFTLESSFAGGVVGKYGRVQFTTQNFQDMGRYFCETLLDYCDPDQTRFKEVCKEVEQLRLFRDDSEVESGSDSDDVSIASKSQPQNPKVGPVRGAAKQDSNGWQGRPPRATAGAPAATGAPRGRPPTGPVPDMANGSGHVSRQLEPSQPSGNRRRIASVSPIRDSTGNVAASSAQTAVSTSSQSRHARSTPDSSTEEASQPVEVAPRKRPVPPSSHYSVATAPTVSIIHSGLEGLGFRNPESVTTTSSGTVIYGSIPKRQADGDAAAQASGPTHAVLPGKRPVTVAQPRRSRASNLPRFSSAGASPAMAPLSVQGSSHAERDSLPKI